MSPTRRPLLSSLQARLLALVLGLLALVWLVASLMTWRDARHEIDELLDSHLAQAAALLIIQEAGAHQRTEEREGSEPASVDDAPSLHPYAPRVAFQVWHEGVLTMRSSNAPRQPMTESGIQRREGFATFRRDGAEWRVFTALGQESDVRVYVGERVDSRTDILQAVLLSLLWPSLVGLPLLALGLWWAVRSATASLRDLGLSLARRSPQDLHAVHAPDAPTEMQPMLGALNDLLARIDALMTAERRFTADAAHELRTPIAAIRAQAQVALAEADDAARRHALQATVSGCDRATRVVEQLLTLSRLEGTAAPATAPVDLPGLVRQVLADIAPRALAKQQQLSLDLPPTADGLQVPGVDTLIGLMLRNLVDNALRYSPPGAIIQVRLQRQADGQVLLGVDDSGPGLSDAEMARLGERFFRVLGSGESGSGLGWSIVQRVAAAQGVAVQVQRSASLGGLAVQLRWAAPA